MIRTEFRFSLYGTVVLERIEGRSVQSIMNPLTLKGDGALRLWKPPAQAVDPVQRAEDKRHSRVVHLEDGISCRVDARERVARCIPDRPVDVDDCEGPRGEDGKRGSATRLVDEDPAHARPIFARGCRGRTVAAGGVVVVAVVGPVVKKGRAREACTLEERGGRTESRQAVSPGGREGRMHGNEGRELTNGYEDTASA